jgi:YteA family regulatory protein
MKAEKLKNLVTKLREEKDRLRKQITRMDDTGLNSALGESLSELSTYDNHPADIGDELFERSKDIALRDTAHVLLESVESALDRVANGSYGKCVSCGKEIEEARLEVIPWANECIHCKKREESKEPTTIRPIEEEVLLPPFGRTFLDTTDFDNVGFDGEDSWQAVARFGSSDSPQDIPGSYNYKALWTNSNEHQGIVDMADFIPNDLTGSTWQGDMSYEEFIDREKLEEDQLPEEISPHH